MKWLIPISLAALGGTARADQCAWVDDAVADRAEALLAHAPKVIAFCEPCGDTVPGVPVAAGAFARTEPSPGFTELWINARSVDLAYTYVQTSPTEYKNLALLAGCPATGVSPTLEVAAETKDGVLITASDKPVVTRAPVPPGRPHPIRASDKPVVTDAQVRPERPQHVYLQSTTRYELPWAALLIATGAGAAIGCLLTLLLVSLRPRRDMRPRASELR